MSRAGWWGAWVAQMASNSRRRRSRGKGAPRRGSPARASPARCAPGVAGSLRPGLRKKRPPGPAPPGGGPGGRGPGPARGGTGAVPEPGRAAGTGAARAAGGGLTGPAGPAGGGACLGHKAASSARSRRLPGRAVRLLYPGYPGFTRPRPCLPVSSGPIPGVQAGIVHTFQVLVRDFLPGTWKGRRAGPGPGATRRPGTGGGLRWSSMRRLRRASRRAWLRGRSWPVSRSPSAVLRKDPDPQGANPQGPKLPVRSGPGPQQGPAHGIGPDVQAQHQRLLFRQWLNSLLAPFVQAGIREIFT